MWPHYGIGQWASRGVASGATTGSPTLTAVIALNQLLFRGDVGGARAAAEALAARPGTPDQAELITRAVIEVERMVRIRPIDDLVWFDDLRRSHAAQHPELVTLLCTIGAYGSAGVDRPEFGVDLASWCLESNAATQSPVLHAFASGSYGSALLRLEPSLARPYLEAAISLARSLDLRFVLMYALRHLGRVAAYEAPTPDTIGLLVESIDVHLGTGEMMQRAISVYGVGQALRRWDRPEDAVRLIEAGRAGTVMWSPSFERELDESPCASFARGWATFATTSCEPQASR